MVQWLLYVNEYDVWSAGWCRAGPLNF